MLEHGEAFPVHVVLGPPLPIGERHTGRNAHVNAQRWGGMGVGVREFDDHLDHDSERCLHDAGCEDCPGYLPLEPEAPSAFEGEPRPLPGRLEPGLGRREGPASSGAALKTGEARLVTHFRTPEEGRERAVEGEQTGPLAVQGVGGERAVFSKDGQTLVLVVEAHRDAGLPVRTNPLFQRGIVQQPLLL